MRLSSGPGTVVAPGNNVRVGLGKLSGARADPCILATG